MDKIVIEVEIKLSSGNIPKIFNDMLATFKNHPDAQISVSDGESALTKVGKQ